MKYVNPSMEAIPSEMLTAKIQSAGKTTIRCSNKFWWLRNTTMKSGSEYSSNEWNFSGSSSASAKFAQALPTRRLKIHAKATKDRVTKDVRGYMFIWGIFFSEPTKTCSPRAHYDVKPRASISNKSFRLISLFNKKLALIGAMQSLSRKEWTPSP